MPGGNFVDIFDLRKGLSLHALSRQLSAFLLFTAKFKGLVHVSTKTGKVADFWRFVVKGLCIILYLRLLRHDMTIHILYLS